MADVSRWISRCVALFGALALGSSWHADIASAEPSWTSTYTITGTRTDSAAFGDFAPGTETSISHTVEFQKVLMPGAKLDFGAAYTDYEVVDDIAPAGFSNAASLASQSVEFYAALAFDAAGLRIKSSALVGIAEYKLERPDTTVAATATGRSRGWNADAKLKISRDFLPAEWLLLRPAVSLKYSYLGVNGFTEQNAGAANVTFGAVHDDRLRLDAGLLASAFLPVGQYGLVTLFAEGSWLHHFLTGPYEATASSALLGPLGTVSLARGAEADGAYTLAGLTWNTPNGAELTIGYEGEFFPSSTSHTAGAVVGFKF